MIVLIYDIHCQPNFWWTPDYSISWELNRHHHQQSDIWVAPGTPKHGISPRSFTEFLKLSRICASSLSRNKRKRLVAWKKTSTSLSHDAFFTALNLLLFPLNVIANLGCCPDGKKKTFKMHNLLLSPVFGCGIHVFLFKFSDVDPFLTSS